MAVTVKPLMSLNYNWCKANHLKENLYRPDSWAPGGFSYEESYRLVCSFAYVVSPGSGTAASRWRGH